MNFKKIVNTSWIVTINWHHDMLFNRHGIWLQTYFSPYVDPDNKLFYSHSKSSKNITSIDRFWSLTSLTFCWKSFARDINLQLYVHRLITSILCIHLLLYCLLCFIAVSLCQTIQFECTGAPYLYLSRTCLYHDASQVSLPERFACDGRVSWRLMFLF